MLDREISFSNIWRRDLIPFRRFMCLLNVIRVVRRLILIKRVKHKVTRVMGHPTCDITGSSVYSFDFTSLPVNEQVRVRKLFTFSTLNFDWPDRSTDYEDKNSGGASKTPWLRIGRSSARVCDWKYLGSPETWKGVKEKGRMKKCGQTNITSEDVTNRESVFHCE